MRPDQAVKMVMATATHAFLSSPPRSPPRQRRALPPTYHAHSHLSHSIRNVRLIQLCYPPLRCRRHGQHPPGAQPQQNRHARTETTRTETLDKRDSFVAKEMTWYPTDTGPDACTGKNHQDSDWFVAMGYDQFGDGSGCCGRKLRINYNGKSTVATCVDECASCPEYGQIDLTKGLFQFFEPDLGVGVFYGSWSYADGDDSGDPPETTTKKTTSTPKPTPKPTPTPTPTPKPTPKPTPTPEPPPPRRSPRRPRSRPSSSPPPPSTPPHPRRPRRVVLRKGVLVREALVLAKAPASSSAAAEPSPTGARPVAGAIGTGSSGALAVAARGVNVVAAVAVAAVLALAL
ncbi:hypothetical protein DFH09DRAFT_1375319 [Mycena vulgaris]|nr:hypothetical protein DFH09DRAFT_1375319 [Mycena vulgaris]